MKGLQTCLVWKRLKLEKTPLLLPKKIINAQKGYKEIKGGKGASRKQSGRGREKRKSPSVRGAWGEPILPRHIPQKKIRT